MKRDVATLTDGEYDCLIVGGGIHGATAAYTAASRGLRTALVERFDFGQGASANSQRILHGGIRYVRDFDVSQMRRSIAAQRDLLRLAPALVRPQEFLLPTYRGRGPSRFALRAAALASNAVERLVDSARRADSPLRPAGLLGPSEVLRAVPGLPEQGLTGALQWWDARVIDSERLTLAFLLAATKLGADVANYAEAVSPLTVGRRICGTTVRDACLGNLHEVRARVVVNAAGAQMDHWVRGAVTSGTMEPPRFVKAVGLVVPRLLGDVGLALRPVGSHPSLLGHMFVTPWEEGSIVGTAYFPGTPDGSSCAASETEIAVLIKAVNSALPDARLGRSQIRMVHAGWLPAREDGRRLLRRPRVLDAHEESGIAGLVSILGVKYTTALGVAGEAVDLVCAKLGKSQIPRGGRQDQTRIPLAPLEGGSDLSHSPERQPRDADRAANLDALVQENPDWAAPLKPGLDVTGAHIVQGVRMEMALRLADVVLRRTELGQRGYPGDAALAACARIMAEELGWSGERTHSEIEDVRSFYRDQGVSPFSTEGSFPV